MIKLADIFAQGLLYPQRFIGGRVRKTDKTIENLKNGEGAIVTIKGKKVAVYKSVDGKLNALSPVCKHLGCLVDWNQKDTSWDCPCHGARYTSDGSVLKGPTKKDLDKISLP